MLTIKAPIDTVSSRFSCASGEGFANKIRGNYELIPAQLQKEDLIHLVSMPPEVYLQETEGGSIVSDTRIANVLVLKLDVINNLLNRIAVTQKMNLTYQDRAYITDVLQRLGVTDVQEFVQQLSSMKEETRSMQRLNRLYWTNLQQLSGTVQDIPESKQIRRETRRKTNVRQTMLQEEIYNRLKTGEIYQILHNFYAAEPAQEQSVGGSELLFAEQERFLSHLLLNRMQEETAQMPVPLTYHYENIYEERREEATSLTMEQADARINAAVLLNVADNLYLHLTQRENRRTDRWIQVQSALYTASENTLQRLTFQTQQESTPLLQKQPRSERLLLQEQETSVLQMLLLMRTLSAAGGEAALSQGEMETPRPAVPPAEALVFRQQEPAAEAELAEEKSEAAPQQTAGNAADETVSADLFRTYLSLLLPPAGENETALQERPSPVNPPLPFAPKEEGPLGRESAAQEQPATDRLRQPDAQTPPAAEGAPADRREEYFSRTDLTYLSPQEQVVQMEPSGGEKEETLLPPKESQNSVLSSLQEAQRQPIRQEMFSERSLYEAGKSPLPAAERIRRVEVPEELTAPAPEKTAGAEEQVSRTDLTFLLPPQPDDADRQAPGEAGGGPLPGGLALDTEQMQPSAREEIRTEEEHFTERILSERQSEQLPAAESGRRENGSLGSAEEGQKGRKADENFYSFTELTYLSPPDLSAAAPGLAKEEAAAPAGDKKSESTPSVPQDKQTVQENPPAGADRLITSQTETIRTETAHEPAEQILSQRRSHEAGGQMPDEAQHILMREALKTAGAVEEGRAAGEAERVSRTDLTFLLPEREEKERRQAPVEADGPGQKSPEESAEQTARSAGEELRREEEHLTQQILSERQSGQFSAPASGRKESGADRLTGPNQEEKSEEENPYGTGHLTYLFRQEDISQSRPPQQEAPAAHREAPISRQTAQQPDKTSAPARSEVIRQEKETAASFAQTSSSERTSERIQQQILLDRQRYETLERETVTPAAKEEPLTLPAAGEESEPSTPARPAPSAGQEELLLQQLQQISRQNMINREQVRTALLQQQKQEAAPKEKTPQENLQKTRQESLLALQNPEKVILEHRMRQEEPPKQTVSAAQEAILSALPKESRKILERAEQIKMQRRQGNLSTSSTDEGMAQLLLDIRRTEEEREEVSHKESRRTSETSERTQEMLLNRQEYQSAPQEGQHEAEAQRNSLSLVHRAVNQTIDEEELQLLLQQNQKARRIDEQSTQTIEQVQLTQQQVQQQVSRTQTQETEDLNELIRTGVRQQVGALSDEIYSKLERRLDRERKRRGY